MVAVLSRIAFVVTENATQKLPLFMSAGVRVVPQRSDDQPYVTVLNVVPHVVPVAALLLPIILHALMSLTVLSLTPRLRVFADHFLFTCTVTPLIVAPSGTLNP